MSYWQGVVHIRVKVNNYYPRFPLIKTSQIHLILYDAHKMTPNNVKNNVRPTLICVYCITIYQEQITI